MFAWFVKNAGTLAPALIGVFGVLLGVLISGAIENRRRKKEQKDKAMPIILNYPRGAVSDTAGIPKYCFQSREEEPVIERIGWFKVADNGIAFLDYVQTETQKLYPLNNSAVDKNTVFIIKLQLTKGETMKGLRLFCHDIFGNHYFYEGKYNFEESQVQNQFLLGVIQKAK